MSRRLVLFALTALAGAPARAQMPPPPPAAALAALLGHYGTGLTEVVVYETDAGALGAWTEGRTIRLTPTGPRTFAAQGGPPWLGTSLHFTPETGRPAALDAGRYRLPRRPRGPEEGDVFRIQPLRPVDGLLREARAARSPHRAGSRPADLVDLARAVPGLRLDVRYATPRNFMGIALYPQARVILQRPAAEAVARVQRALAPHGVGLLAYDGYRPWYVTKAFWDATPPEQHSFVANPATGSRHNRGCAVDIGLYDLATGEAVAMPSDYDEFTARAHPNYVGGTARARHFRALLRRTMEAHGFTINETEWWHYDFNACAGYGVLNVPFEAVR